MRGHNICFCGEIRKIIFELSLIHTLIWRSGVINFWIFESLQKIGQCWGKIEKLGNFEVGLIVKVPFF